MAEISLQELRDKFEFTDGVSDAEKKKKVEHARTVVEVIANPETDKIVDDVDVAYTEAEKKDKKKVPFDQVETRLMELRGYFVSINTDGRAEEILTELANEGLDFKAAEELDGIDYYGEVEMLIGKAKDKRELLAEAASVVASDTEIFSSNFDDVDEAKDLLRKIGVKMEGDPDDEIVENALSKEDFVELIRNVMITKSQGEIDKEKGEARQLAEGTLRDMKLDIIYIRGGREIDKVKGIAHRKKVEALLISLEKGEITEDHKSLLEAMKVKDVDKVLEDWGVKVAEDEAPKVPAAEKEKKKTDRNKINTIEELENYVRSLDLIVLGSEGTQVIIKKLTTDLKSLLEDMADPSTNTVERTRISLLAKAIDEQIKTYRERMGVAKLDVIEGDMPKNKEDKEAWRKWIRNRLRAVVEPFLLAGETRITAEQALRVTISDTMGIRPVDSLSYAHNDVKREMDYKIGEVSVVTRLSNVFHDWRDYRTELKKMTNSAFEDGSRYQLPNNELNNRVLRELTGESGEPREGAENVSEALKIYWAMANPEDITSAKILEVYGVSESENLFNKKLSANEVKEIRERIAGACGGAYYESLAMTYASFFGLVAKGNNGEESSLSDGMAVLYNINQSKFLSPELKNSLTIANSGGKKTISFMPSLSELQGGGKKKNFYVVKDGDSYILQTKLAGGQIDSGLTLDNLIKAGELWKVNWQGGDFELMAALKKRESVAVKMANMFNDLSKDTPASLLKTDQTGSSALGKNLKTIEDSLAHYDIRTKQRACFIWLWAQLKHNEKWLEQDKDGVNKERLDLLIKALRTTKPPWLTEEDLAELVKRFPIDQKIYILGKDFNWKKAGKHYGEKGKGYWRNTWIFSKVFKEITPKQKYKDRSFLASTKREALAMGGVRSFVGKVSGNLYRFSSENLKRAANKTVDFYHLAKDKLKRVVRRSRAIHRFYKPVVMEELDKLDKWGQVTNEKIDVKYQEMKQKLRDKGYGV